MTDVAVLACYVHELHKRLGRLLLRDLNDATDEYYRPHPGGLLEEYLKAVDEMGDRFSIRDRERFYPAGDAGIDEGDENTAVQGEEHPPMTDDPTVPRFVQIATAADANGRPLVFALDESGQVWLYTWREEIWGRLAPARTEPGSRVRIVGLSPPERNTP